MKATKICKICGNEYEYCHTFRRDSIFRWQDVACCVEHGNQYFAEIAASRGEAPKPEVVAEPVVVDETPVEEPTLFWEKVSEEVELVSPKKKSRK